MLLDCPPAGLPGLGLCRGQARPGLTVSSGALWTDEAQCHWLDPANQAVTANLIQICRELQERGFDEVVWTDFRIPDSGSIAYTAAASKDAILRQAARQLASCASQSFMVSFSDSGDFPFPPVKPGCTWRTLPRSRPPALRKHALCPTAAPRWCSSPPARTPLRCIQRAAPFGMTSPCSSENILPIRRRLNPLL